MLVKKVNIKYFAILKEQAKKTTENFNTVAITAADLYQELSRSYLFSLSENQVKVAINEQFMPLNTVLKTNDRIVFIPPVAGG